MCTPIPEGKINSQRKREFNSEFCRARVIVEDTIGIIKNRWPPLKGELSFHSDMKKCARYIQALVALHNYIVRHERDVDFYR